MKKNAGFTLIELMIVVAIIAIIAAIAIPNLLRSRMQSNESAAVGNVRTVNTAEVAYHASNSAYAQAFADMTGATPPFLDGDWAVSKQGYDFTLGAAAAGGVQNFAVNADPTSVGTTGNRYFYSDGSGVIRFNDAAAAGPGDAPLGQV